MLIRDLLDTEYSPIRALRPKAVLQFRLTLTRWSDFLGRGPVLTDMQGLPVQAFLAARRAVVSQATVLKDRVHICALWTYAAKRRLVAEFPTLPPMRAPKRIPRAYRLEDVSAIVRVCRSLPGVVSGLPRGLYYSTLVRSCWETGERIGAHRALEWADVDLSQRAIIFRAENRKGGSADIRREITAGLAEWLDELRRHASSLVWPWDRHETLLWHEFGKICVIAEVTPRGFHGFRKASASYLAMAGGDASAHLGHASPQTTRDHYLDPSIVRPLISPVDLLPALDLAEPAFCPRKTGPQENSLTPLDGPSR